jgi:hypothetical protein
LSEEEDIEVLERFARELLDNQVEPDPEITKAVRDHFWEIFEPFE